MGSVKLSVSVPEGMWLPITQRWPEKGASELIQLALEALMQENEIEQLVLVLVPASQATEIQEQYDLDNSYPWDDWFDGNPHILRAGVDFSTPIETMRTTVLGKAWRGGFTVVTSVTSDGDRLAIRKTSDHR